MDDPLNLHSYDGKLNSRFLNSLEVVRSIPLETKRKQILDFQRHIKISPEAAQILDIIVKSVGTSANIDPSNNLNADDLLYLCWDHRDNPDFIQILDIQLIDMKTGLCPQGRTHRLFQTLIAFLGDTMN